KRSDWNTEKLILPKVISPDRSSRTSFSEVCFRFYLGLICRAITNSSRQFDFLNNLTDQFFNVEEFSLILDINKSYGGACCLRSCCTSHAMNIILWIRWNIVVDYNAYS